MYALTAKGMKYMDQFASQAGLPGVVLMENAARGVADEVAERAEVYRPQLDAYAAALSQVLEKPVKHKILYFFEQNCEISLK